MVTSIETDTSTPDVPPMTEPQVVDVPARVARPRADTPVVRVTPPPPPSSARPVARPSELRPPRPAPNPPRAEGEPLSPFVAWSDDVRGALDVGPLEQARARRNVFVEIVTEPDRFAARILDARELQSAIVTATAAVVLGTAAFAAVVRMDEGPLTAVGAAGRLALSVLLAIAAAMGPIHAAGILVAARVPLPRLVAVMMASTAVGMLMLAPLAPVVRFLHDYDAMWMGPLALMGAFAMAATVGGVTLWRLLRELAVAMARARGGERARLGDSDTFRVGIVARLSLVFMGYTAMLALWGLRAFS